MPAKSGFSRFVLALAAGALAATLGTPASAQTSNGALAGAGTIPGLDPKSPIKVLPVRGNIYVLMGGGANITLSVGLDGVLMVDTEDPQLAAKTLDTIRTFTSAPIKIVVNSHIHPDHPAVMHSLRNRGR